MLLDSGTRVTDDKMYALISLKEILQYLLKTLSDQKYYVIV